MCLFVYFYRKLTFYFIQKFRLKCNLIHAHIDSYVTQFQIYLCFICMNDLQNTDDQSNLIDLYFCLVFNIFRDDVMSFISDVTYFSAFLYLSQIKEK